MGNVSVKHRLLGALVLISLVVIFVPMLLDEKWEFGGVIQQSNIPLEPKLKFEVTNSGKLKQIVTRAESQDTVTFVDDDYNDEQANNIDERLEKKDNEIDSPLKNKTSISQEISADQKSSETQKPIEKTTQVKTKAQSPIYKTGGQPAGINAWAVQLGSFKSHKNAVELRNRLRKKKYTAYIESYNADTGTAFRVRVGPELQLDQAKTLKAKLAGELKIEGIIMQH